MIIKICVAVDLFPDSKNSEEACLFLTLSNGRVVGSPREQTIYRWVCRYS